MYNKQADYSTHFGNVSYTNALQLYGSDIDLNLNYKRKIVNDVFVKIGPMLNLFGSLLF